MNRILPYLLVVVAVGMLAWAAFQAGDSSPDGEPSSPPVHEPLPGPGPGGPVPSDDGGPAAVPDGAAPGTDGSPVVPRPVRVPRLDEVQALLDEGKREDALAGLDRILGADPENVEARLLRGRTYRAMNWNRLAETDLREVLAKSGESSPVLEELAEAVQGTRSDEAVKLLTRSIELSPNRAHPHALLAAIHFRKGRRAEAREAVERALTIDSTDALALSLDEQLRR